MVGKPSTRVVEGAAVEVEVAEAPAPRVGVEPDASVEVPVVLEDPAFVVVDKPAGLVVHPGAGHSHHTLVSGLVARYPEMAGVGEPERPGLVHRLDRDTSGLLVVARTDEAYHDLVAQLSARTVSRRYEAVVLGHPEAPSGMVDAPIGRSPRQPTLMAVRADGKEARTRYQVEEQFDRPGPCARVECRLETGRTHQIRVHMRGHRPPRAGRRALRRRAHRGRVPPPVPPRRRAGVPPPRHRGRGPGRVAAPARTWWPCSPPSAPPDRPRAGCPLAAQRENL